MSTFNRLFGLAAKALDKTGSSTSASGGAPASGAGDWRSMVRSAADALTGDAQKRPTAGTTPPVYGAAPGASYGTNPPSAYGTTPPAYGATPPAYGATPPAYGATPPSAYSTTTSRPGMTPPPAADSPADAADRAAIARYDYLMQTADPHQIERIHQEAFARLSPAQRAQIEARMRAELPPHEQPASAAPADLARAAARSEAMQPGRMRGLLGRAGGATAIAGAGVAAGGLLGLVAGGAIATAVAAPLLAQAADFGVDFDAIAQGVDLDAVTGGAFDAAGEQISGIGEQVSGFGEGLPDFGLGDFFGS
jgi:hypothetical protein